MNKILIFMITEIYLRF